MVENQLMGLSSLMRELQQALMREAMAPGTGRRSMGRSEVVVPQHGGYATETAFPGTIALAPGSRLPLETDISGHLYKQVRAPSAEPGVYVCVFSIDAPICKKRNTPGMEIVLVPILLVVVLYALLLGSLFRHRQSAVA